MNDNPRVQVTLADGKTEVWEFLYGGPSRGAPIMDHPRGSMFASGWLYVTDAEIYRLFVCDTEVDEFRRRSGRIWLGRRVEHTPYCVDVTQELGVTSIAFYDGDFTFEHPHRPRLIHWADAWDKTVRVVRGLFKWQRVRTKWYPRGHGTLQLPDVAVWEAGPDIWRLYGFIIEKYLDAYDDGTVTPADFTSVDENGLPQKRHHEVGVVRELYHRYKQIDPDEYYYRDVDGIKPVEGSWPNDDCWEAEEDGVRRMRPLVYRPGTPESKFWFSGHAMAEQWIADFSKVMWAMWD